MPRRARVTPGGLVYHVLNRTVAGTKLAASPFRPLIVLSEWTKDGDFRAACRVLKNIREVPGEVMEWMNGNGPRADFVPLR